MPPVAHLTPPHSSRQRLRAAGTFGWAVWKLSHTLLKALGGLLKVLGGLLKASGGLLKASGGLL